MFRAYPLSHETLADVKSKYFAKLKNSMNIRAKLKSNDEEHPIVTLTAATIDRQRAAQLGSQGKDMLTVAVMKRLKQSEGVSETALRSDAEFQQTTLVSIEKFIDQIPMNGERSLDVRCDRVERDGKYYYIPSDLSTLKNFIDPMFEIKAADDTAIDSFVEAIFAPRGAYEIKKPETKPEPEKPSVEPVKEKYNPNDKWLVYWYVCGTDIESQRTPGDVNRCIREIENADFASGNVQIFMQAGGTTKWKHPAFEANNGKVGLYLYGKDNRDWNAKSLVPINTNDPKTLMNTTEGLINFLEYGRNVIEPQVKPDHRVFIFVDHGGGSLIGVGLDEYRPLKNDGRFDALDLSEMQTAFKHVWGDRIKAGDPPFELIAFDACLMSTYETAVSLEGIARYMAASQETIYGAVMFEYTGLISTLSKNPAMNGKQLGEVICNTYWNDCSKIEQLNGGKEAWHSAKVFSPTEICTMSVVELSKMNMLDKAYENFGKAASDYARQNPNASITYFEDALSHSEYYQDPSSVDLKTLAESVKVTRGLSNSNSLVQSSDALIRAIDGINYNGAVVYQVRGPALRRGGGLTTYYPYNLVVQGQNISTYIELADKNIAPKAQANFYKMIYEARYGKGVKTRVAQNNSSSDINALDPNEIQAALKGGFFDLSALNQTWTYVDEEDMTVSVDIDEEYLDRISRVQGQLIYLKDVKSNDGVAHIIALYLGSDNNVQSDWETGEFKSTFDGKWLTINGQPIYMNLVANSTAIGADGKKSGSELYSALILLNDQPRTLLISCQYPDETFKIIGARVESNTSIPTGEIDGVGSGDVIKPIFLGLFLPWDIDPNSELAKTLDKFSTKDDDPEDFFRQIFEPDKAAKSDPKEQPTMQERMDALEQLAKSGNVIKYISDPIVVGDTLDIERGALPDGNYGYVFEFVNPVAAGLANAYSQMDAIFTIDNGKVTLLRDAIDIEKPGDLER